MAYHKGDNTMKLDLRDVQLRRVLAIAALGMAGFGGVAACASTVPAGAQPHSPASALSRAVPTTHEGAARTIARMATGNGELAALNNGSGRAVMATCDPGTVSNRVGAAMSASCGIRYSDGSVWRQTVTVTSDGHGIPVSDGANLGTEVLPPTGG
jgi:hypothetical protein